MLLKKIKLENIRSYKTIEVAFPEGSVLFSGDIGSGKTSILLAIEFALFGLQPGQKGISLLRNGEKEGKVELDFSIDSKDFKIERVLKRDSKSVSQDYVAITENNTTNEMSITELKNRILSLLNYPLEFARKTNILYRFTVYTPQEEMKQIILEDSETRLNTLRHIFGVDKYKRIKENTSFLAAKLREESRRKEGIIQNLDALKEEIESKKIRALDLMNQLSKLDKSLAGAIEETKKAKLALTSIEEKISEKERYEKEIEKNEVMIFAKRESLMRLEKEIIEIRKNYEEEIKKFNQEELDGIIKLLIDKNQILEVHSKELISIESKIKLLEFKRNDQEKRKETVQGIILCPTCLQDVPDSHKSNISVKIDQEISQINNELSTFIPLKNEKNNNVYNIKKEISELEEKKSNLSILKAKIENLKTNYAKIKDLDKQRQSLSSDVEMLQKHIFGLKDTVVSLKKYENLYTARGKELEEKMKKEKEIEITKAETIKEKEFAREQINKLDKDIKEKEEEKKKLAYLSELEAWLTATFLHLVSYTERNILLKLREQFSKLFNEWFSILVTDSFIARLDEDFTPVVEQQGYSLDYSFLSGGERTAVALAYRLALNQTINSLLSKIKTRNIVILDEPTDGFSDQQLDKMRDVLDQLNVEQLILVSHEQKIESFVDNVIRFKKEDGTSKIEEA